jgi:hypothetical protein
MVEWMSSTGCLLHSGKPVAQTWRKQQIPLWNVRTPGLRHNQRLAQGEPLFKPDLRPESDYSDTLLEHFRNTYRLFESREGRLFLEEKAT